MSRYEYEESRRLVAGDPSFRALVMAAMRRADTPNLERLCEAFPEIYDELAARYQAPAGVLPGEPG